MTHPCRTPDCGQIRCGSCDERITCLGPTPAPVACGAHDDCCTDCVADSPCRECRELLAEVAQDRADDLAFSAARGD